MSLVFNTPKVALDTITKQARNYEVGSGCNLDSAEVTYSENGEYTLTPEGFDGFSEVEITVDVPSDVNNEDKTVTITANGTETYTAGQGYTGIGEITVTTNVQPDLEDKSATYVSNGEYTITPTSGKDGIAEATITVAVPSDINNQNKTATPSTSQQTITADIGYSGLGTVTVEAVTAAIDSDIVAGNIKKDVEILGVTGTYDPQPDLESKTVNSSTVQQVVTPTAGKDGLSSVTVEPYTLQAKSATPTTSQQVIEPDNDKDGLSSVTVSAVTASIDANITAGNIKDGVTILGVTGSYDPQPTLDTLNVTPSTSAQTLTPTSPVDGFDEVVVSAVTSSIDANIAAGNIKKDVTILGVTGTYDPQPDLETKTVTYTVNDTYTITPTAGKDGLSSVEVTVNVPTSGTNVPDWSSIGWSNADVATAGVTAAVAYTETVKNNNSWKSNNQLVFAPKQSNSENGEVFSSCSNLTFVPNFTFTGSTASLYQAFRYCSSLQAVGDIIRPNATSGGTADNMFEQDAALKSVGIIDMRGITSASGMFSGCNAIQSVTLSNTTALANANNMFYNCKSLQSINIPNTSSLTSVSGMFKSAYPTASVCTSISAFDTSNVTNFSSMFEAADSTVYSGASRFTTAPSLDMSSATDVSFMFKTTNTSNGWLTTIPQYDWGNVENVSSVFYNQTDLQNLGGFINLGKSFKGTSSSQHKLTFKGQIASYIADITKQSAMNIINNLAAPDDPTCTDATLEIKSTTYNQLTAEEIAIATAKNWAVISA